MQKILTLLLLFLTAANVQGDNKEIINHHCFKQLDAFNAKKKINATQSDIHSICLLLCHTYDKVKEG